MSDGRLKAAWTRIVLLFKVLSEFVKLASAILGLIAAGGIIAAVIGFVTQRWTIFATGGLVASGILVAIWVLYRNILEATSLRADLYWKKAKYSFQIFEDNVSMQQVAEITVQALRDGIDRLQNKYYWTGRGEMRLEILSKGHHLLGKPVLKEAWHYYDVSLGRSLRAGETETVVIRQTMRDTAGTFEPILTKTVTEPLEHLTLEVIPSRTSPPDKVIRFEHASYFPTHPVRSEAMPWHKEEEKIVWEIDSPKLHHTYGIRWGFVQPLVEVEVEH